MGDMILVYTPPIRLLASPCLSFLSSVNRKNETEIGSFNTCSAIAQPLSTPTAHILDSFISRVSQEESSTFQEVIVSFVLGKNL
jgi:hypothetical protein